jgi:hypothetical protein
VIASHGWPRASSGPTIGLDVKSWMTGFKTEFNILPRTPVGRCPSQGERRGRRPPSRVDALTGGRAPRSPTGLGRPDEVRSPGVRGHPARDRSLRAPEGVGRMQVDQRRDATPCRCRFRLLCTITPLVYSVYSSAQIVTNDLWQKSQSDQGLGRTVALCVHVHSQPWTGCQTL